MDNKKMLLENKESAFYAVTLAAWYNTLLEHDKSLLILSAGGIALLIFSLLFISIDSFLILLLYNAAILSFMICISAVLGILKRNAYSLADIIQKNPANRSLKFLDTIASVSFVLAIFFFTILIILFTNNLHYYLN